MKSLIVFLALFFQLANPVLASDLKHTFSICSLFKDEAEYLEEWIEYHRLIGADHFYLYNCSSQDHFMQVLKPYIAKNLVTLINWSLNCQGIDDKNSPHWALSVQVPVYENVVHAHAKNETKWLAILGVDEFIVPTEVNDLRALLKQYDDQPGIAITSDCFDAYSLDFIPHKKLVTEMTTRTALPKEKVEIQYERAIFKPALCKGFYWPPYQCIFEDGKTAKKISKKNLRLNHYQNRFKGSLRFQKEKEKLKLDHLQVPEDKKKELIQQGFDLEGEEKLIQRFLPKLKNRLSR